ncbi:MAG: hypothetical protein NT151_06760 [Acidobacteria bacterium]|nr:hypothetical protein [Acidobacteriota bacterium]
MTRFAARAFVVGILTMAVSVLSAACGGGTTAAALTTAATLTAPTPVSTTETYSGTLAQTGVDTYPFAATVTGAMTIGLTAVGPLATLSIGVGIGTWDGTTCTLIAKNDNSKAGLVALSGTAVAGNFCVQVYDSGNIPDSTSVTYTVQVVHF